MDSGHSSDCIKLSMCVVVVGHTDALACVWRSEDSLQKSVLLFHQGGSGDQTQVIRLGGKCLELQSHLGCPSLVRDSFSGYNIFT